VTEVGAVSAAGWAWSVHDQHTTVGLVGMAGWALSLHGILHLRCWLGMVVARQADLSGRLGATGR